ncbi:methyltransferase domain-containing protein [Thermococcus sp.]|uniref:class I SAM-dependent methyltransferase n=1 Tax=Thermococcus sp. TaxID=35749 RepID=UPI0026201160|nr:methyltransferase domain-containing protein [Thermococcus sp.]
MKPPVELLDENLSSMARISLFHLFQIGLKYGVFQSLSTPTPYEDFIKSAPLPNRALLRRLIETYIRLGLVRREGDILKASTFSYQLKLTPKNAEGLTVDWIPVHEEIYRMVDYAFISSEHPKILMDFDNDSDFWDMRLSLEINRLYREVISSVAGLEDGMRVLDLGCGSVSPVELGGVAGPNGRYVGVDFSPGLLSIARTRVKELGMDWVELREMDVRRILPKKRYDVVVMSFILEYIESPEQLVAKALGMLDEGGKLVILEPFQEVSPYMPAWGFFESLTKEFVEFPSRGDLLAHLEGLGVDAKVKPLGNSVLVLQTP